MLKAPIEFPFAGSTGFLRPDGRAVRIVQHLASGECLVALASKERTRDASDNFRVAFAELAALEEDACNPDTDPRPRRIKLQRKAGWKLPIDAVSVARPSKWGNPFRIGAPGSETAEAAVELYRAFLVTLEATEQPSHDLAELSGKHLACHCQLCDAHALGKPLGVDCPDCAPCHADVLLERANG